MPYTLPICVGFLFVGISCGIFIKSKGIPSIYPILMSYFIFAGSMEFVTAELLCASFNPLSAFFTALTVNARHLFYGISMLDRYKNTGLKKPYLIFGMCDETFTVNCAVEPPAGVDRGWFMLFVTLLNRAYWVFGVALGTFAGSFIPFNTDGIEFVMTALFVVMFVNQWEENKNHLPALTGVTGAAICLLIFGADIFLLPSMALVTVILAITKNYNLKGEKSE